MTELDQMWSQMLAGAEREASSAGLKHLAEYLRLKATNDAIREVGVRWLLDSMVEIASDAMRDHKTLSVIRETPYSFARGTSNMVGSCLTFRHGVRCLTLEAGWARSPSDGVMRHAALAVARVTHFGMPRETSEYRLLRADPLPLWSDERGQTIDTAELRRHFELFLK